MTTKTTTTLTIEQTNLLLQVYRFLQQFSDRGQMRADAYLAKYMNWRPCEEIVDELKYQLEKEFPDAKP